jgi:branched-chain amino acid transport system permease protein
VVESTLGRYAWRDGVAGELAVVAAFAAFVAVFPWLFARAPVVSETLQGYQGLATLILIWGIFAVGFDLLLGYTGLLSFGHAVFWGWAAYAAAIFSVNVSDSPVLMVVAGATIAALLAWVLGFLSLRRGGIYFAILTLAWGQMSYYLALSPLAGLTNGENGFTGMEVGQLFGQVYLESPLPVPALAELLGNWMYVFVGTIAVLAVWATYRILHSPYGLVFQAIRENELRTEFVGLNVWRYKLMSFILSGTLAGVAGSLFAIHGHYVPLESLYWTTSGEIVIMTVLGGVGSLFGPIVGAGLYLYVENIVSGFPDLGSYWHLILGVLFVVAVALFPRGIWGFVEDVAHAVARLLFGRE